MITFTESTVESAALAWLALLGWEVRHGGEIAPGEPFAERRDYGQVILEQRLRDALGRLNPDLPPEALEDAFRKLARPEGATLEQRNRAVHRMLVQGVTVEYRRPDGSIAGAQARVVDLDDPDNNDWLAVNQFTVSEEPPHAPAGHRPLRQRPAARRSSSSRTRPTSRPPSGPPTTSSRPTRHEIPSLFAYNEVLVISDGLEARIGTLTADRERFMPWRTIEGDDVAPLETPQLEVLVKGVFERRRFLQLLRDFIVFEDDGGGKLAKKMAGYHQFHAVTWRWRKRCVLPSWFAPTAWQRTEGATSRPAATAASPAPGASAWSGIPRARARA
ncbi:MAG: hypothetical protein KatS3mg082_3062 [Nitrospiraceae bacterium]|nr:MAG: hypothetical protein KatS3mg082_3062 [Nitrospiraceae bacterium]